MAEGTLNVIALVSGGKDSFFSILHCLANGHRIVALANLYPQSPSASTGPAATATIRDPSFDTSSQPHPGEDEDEADLNSFMYQTVGHQVIPLYAQATGLPLFRHPIVGTAVHHGLNYQAPQEKEKDSKIAATAVEGVTATADESTTTAIQQGPPPPPPPRPPPPPPPTITQEQQQQDETESLVPLLRAVLTAHPEANALSTGAILSTYQRTRVESVALRLGLVPLSYLWQYPELPLNRANETNAANDVTGKAERSTGQQQQQQLLLSRRQGATRRDDAQLLRDMATAGLDARIVKVASAGLDESFLWENVASEAGRRRVERGMRRFGGRGSVLGEGGEFETLVVDGPPSLFKGGRIVVREESRRVVQEGGGSFWLSIRDAMVEARGKGNDVSQEKEDESSRVRIPGLLDPRFEATLDALVGETGQSGHDVAQLESTQSQLPPLGQTAASDFAQQWCFVGRDGDQDQAGVEPQTARVVADIRRQLQEHALPVSAITNAIIVLRYMSDFPAINRLYGSLFEEPNPPSRVTISCGDALPEGCSIAIYLTVHTHLNNNNRRGLHVQSRSYWAPANIGPYSQAISVPLLTPISTDMDLAVSIAGQIPLLPASMVLPDASSIASSDNLALQTTLALQHLWRVAAAVDVQWWTSAVAYFPCPSSSSSGDSDVQRRAALGAAAAWRSAHLWAPAGEDGDEDEEEGGPDLWDRRFNPAYRSFGDEEADKTPIVPDWEVVKGFDGAGGEDDDGDASLREKKKRQCVPFFFAAEVDELPRRAGIEWHAHLGLAKLRLGSVRIVSRRNVQSSASSARVFELHHVVVELPGGVFVQSAAAVQLADPRGDQDRDLEAAILDARREVILSLAATTSSSTTSPGVSGDQPPGPGDDDATSLHLIYVDAEAFPPMSLSPPQAIIPCRSLWGSRGERLALVVLFQSWFLPPCEGVVSN